MVLEMRARADDYKASSVNHLLEVYFTQLLRNR